MTHIEKAKELSDKILMLCLPLSRERLNAGIFAHAMLFTATRLLLAFAVRRTPHVTEAAASDAFAELMEEINSAVMRKFRSLGIPISGIDLDADVNDPPTNPFYGN